MLSKKGGAWGGGAGVGEKSGSLAVNSGKKRIGEKVDRSFFKRNSRKGKTARRLGGKKGDEKFVRGKGKKEMWRKGRVLRGGGGEREFGGSPGKKRFEGREGAVDQKKACTIRSFRKITKGERGKRPVQR